MPWMQHVKEIFICSYEGCILPVSYYAILRKDSRSMWKQGIFTAIFFADMHTANRRNSLVQTVYTMKSLSLAWLWLVCTGYIMCNPTKHFASDVKSFDIPRVIDSIHQLYQNREIYNDICSKRMSEVIKELGLKGYDNIWMDISRFLRRIRDLRTLLLMEDVVEKDIESNIKDPFIFAMISVFTMKDVIDDLRPRFIEWKRQGIRDIKEDITFEWFNYHRFTKDILKDVEMKDFAGMVEGIYKEDVFSKRLLEFGGTILFLKPECHLYNALPWLATFYNNLKTVEITERFFQGYEEFINASTYSEIMAGLSQKRTEMSIYRKMFDAYKRKEVYSLYMNIYSHACVLDEQIELYMKVLGYIFNEWERYPSKTELMFNVEKPGVSLNRYKIPGFTFTSKLESDDGASEHNPPPADDISSNADQFLLNDEEELGFVGLNRVSKKEEYVRGSHHRVLHGILTLRLRFTRNTSKNSV